MRALRLVSLLALAAGCAKELTPRSVLFDLRVLAMRATPLEVGPSDAVTLDAVRLPPPGATIVEERWTFCPFSVGSSAAYACAVPACETELVPSGSPADPVSSAPVTASPGALALACVTLLSSSGALPADVPRQLPEKVDTIFRYVVRASDGSTREAVQRLPLYPAGAPADRNVPPEIASVEIGGIQYPHAGPDPTLASGAELDVVVTLTPESAQTYVEGGRTLTEQLVVSFYTTNGRFDYDWANGPVASVKLKGDSLVAGMTSAQVWVVARDLRGGEAVGGPFTVAVTP
jgi:hypothetical protein